MQVVVTGMGMVTPLGVGVDETWRRVVAGHNAIGPIQRFDPTGFDVGFAAEVADPGWPSAFPVAGLPQALQPLAGDLKGRLAAWALAEALLAAGWDVAPGAADPRVGVCVGSEAARPPLSALHERLQDPRPPSAAEVLVHAPEAPTLLAAAMAGAGGPRSTISTACTSSSQAVGEGLLRIRRGEVDAMIVGGADVLVDPIMVTGFSLLGALSTRNDDPASASRPFDVDRDGFVLGEGAGFLVLESAERAARRGATPLALLSGFGCSCNAWRITDSPPDGRGAAQSMAAALLDAGLTAGDIGYVNAHGTSTQQNDASESAGIQRVFEGHRPAVSSTKGLMGHLVAACGAVEAILCALAVRDGIAPVNRNLDRPDPACDLDLVRGEARRGPIRHAMTNAFGFGGSNGTLILSRPGDPA
ncbi:MAG: beta-ketoacyl-[acyl-carrier-protein] synthase family protein [Alphaproteobacteria bacterium]|nr:beta-ketoacyl-[acyl-carrier-protein] synthase family protein [Alphaproteobacteria bacterium]